MFKPLRSAAIVATLLWAPIGASNAMAASYDIDLVHSGISFTIDHLGFSKVIGMATDFSGSFDFDAADPTTSALEVSVKVASIFTNNQQRDSDIQGADWFNATEFPDITFVGKEFNKIDDKTGTITGDLTIAGVTKPVTLDVVFNMEGQNPWDGSHVVGFSARTMVKRSDYGLQAALGMIGDEVELNIQVEGRGRQ